MSKRAVLILTVLVLSTLRFLLGDINRPTRLVWRHPVLRVSSCFAVSSVFYSFTETN